MLYEKFYDYCSVFLDKSLTGGAKCYINHEKSNEVLASKGDNEPGQAIDDEIRKI